MENIEEEETAVLVITEDIRSYIYEAARWTKFLAIIGFVVTGFMVMLSFSAGAIIGVMNKTYGEANNPWAALGSGFLTVVLLLSALLYFYPSLLLFKYSGSAKQAVLFADQDALGIAMGKMKSFFKFWGIITIVILAFCFIAILFAIVASIGAASMGG